MSKRLPPRRHCPIGVWFSEVSVPFSRLEKASLSQVQQLPSRVWSSEDGLTSLPGVFLAGRP